MSKAPAHSAGVLLFRRGARGVEVLLAHPGGPFWAKRDRGAWSIPKGEFDRATESPIEAARREFREETGACVSGDMLELGTFAQPSGKLVSAWAAECDFDPRELRSNECRVEWPPHSGRSIEVPEVDRAQWFSIEEAMTRIVRGQVAILQAFSRKMNEATAPRGDGS